MGDKKVSIIICSLGRPEVLRQCLKSLDKQTYKDFEVILCEEEGNLVELKDKGWRKAKGEIVAWLDDDVVCDRMWLENMVWKFDRDPRIAGITGLTLVPPGYLLNRDILSGGIKQWLYNKIFLDGKMFYPGKISSWGASTLGANYPTIHSYETQEVDFLEPCQFAFRKKLVEKVGGFDLDFTGVAEWCDVDLAYKIKGLGILLYCPEVKVYHYPIKDKVYNKRLETASRYRNYCRWADRWLKPSLKNEIYRLFLKTYFWLKEE
jgi:GT2 family glycosyltransferase